MRLAIAFASVVSLLGGCAVYSEPYYGHSGYPYHRPAAVVTYRPVIVNDPVVVYPAYVPYRRHHHGRRPGEYRR